MWKWACQIKQTQENSCKADFVYMLQMNIAIIYLAVSYLWVFFYLRCQIILSYPTFYSKGMCRKLMLKRGYSFQFCCLLVGKHLTYTPLHIFMRGSIEFHDAELLQQEKSTCDVIFLFSLPSSINAVSQVSVVVLHVSHTWPQHQPWRHSQVYKFTYPLWDTLIRTQNIQWTVKKIDSTNQAPAHNEHFLPSKEYIHDLGTFYEEGDGRLTPDVS